MLSCETKSIDQACYFTLSPHHDAQNPACSPTYSAAGDETPADPVNPFLAFRQLPHSPSHAPSMAANFMSLQTSAAHSHTSSRPRPQPIQNVLHVSDDSGSGSDTSSDYAGSSPPLASARCSRCQRTSSNDVNTGKSNMLQYGLNLWYCRRCADMVGLGGNR